MTNEERAAIQEQVIARASSWQTSSVSEDTFLSELKNVELRFSPRRMFVGLTHFVNNILVPKGYSYLSCQAMIERLSNAGKIEIYYVPHPTDSAKQTAALRTSDQGAG
ncbi:MAG: hypothetical protein NTY01_10415 [Verrucomicrobia bacterium]|nr:hypothetical protein [Verrucomicrobiota bacterium]